MQTTNKLKNKKSIVILIVSISLICLIALGIGFTISWFENSTKVLGGDLTLGTLQTDLYLYDYDATNNTLDLKSSFVNNVQTSSGSPKIILESNWSSGSLGVAYIKAENVGNIDSKVFLQMVCTSATNMDEHTFNYTYVRIKDITADVAAANTLKNYAQSFYNDHMTTSQDTATEVAEVGANGVVLSSIIKQAKKLGDTTIAQSSTRYYQLEYANIGTPNEYLNATIKATSLDLSFDIQQFNMPDEYESINQVIYVDSATAFKDVITAAASGDTIILSNNIDLTDYNLTITQRVNIDLNGFNLHVGGNMAYDFSSYGDCDLVIPSTSKLTVDGDLIFDIPSTNFSIQGSANEGILVGSYKNNKVIGGDIVVNTVRDDSDGSGFNVNNITIKKTTGNNTTKTADLTIQSNTRVNIGVSTVINDIIAENGASNIYIINNGYINKIDISAMNYRGLDENQIYIVNNGKFLYTSAAPIILPAWSRGYISSVDENGKGNYQVNTQVVNNPGRDLITVGVRYPDASSQNIYTAESRAHAIASNPTDTAIFNDIYFWNIDISRENVTNSRVVRNRENDYTVYLYGDNRDGGEPDSIQGRLADFFDEAENSQWASEEGQYTKLTIRTYSIVVEGTSVSTQGTIKPTDWAFLRTLNSLYTLDLSGAKFENDTIVEGAMKDRENLYEVEFPTVENITIAKNAFNGTNVHFVTLYPNIVSIGTTAFAPKTGSAYAGYCFVKWMGGSAPSDAVLGGLNTSYNVLFMDESLLNSFRAAKTAWALFAYELFDYVSTDNNSFYRITGTKEARYVYYHAVIHDLDGDTNDILPKESSPSNNTTKKYLTTSIGNGAFRRAIYRRNNDTSVDDKYFKVIMPSTVLKIGDYAFYEAKISELSLNNVREIGSYAFANTHIKKSNERPATYQGTQKLGEYIFKDSKIGPFTDSTISLTDYETKCITFDTNGKFTTVNSEGNTVKYNYTAGTLDLSGDYSLTSGNTFRNILIVGIELKLSGINALYGPEYTAQTTLQKPFESTRMYGCSLDLSGIDYLGQEVFYYTLNYDSSKTFLKPYSNVDMRDVRTVNKNLFVYLYVYSLKMGIATANENDNYIRPIVNGMLSVDVFDISGSLPDENTDTQWFNTAYPVVGALTIHDYSGKIPSKLFGCWSVVYSQSIGTLTITNNVKNIEFGRRSFACCTIGTANINVTGTIDIDYSAFGATKFTNLTMASTGALTIGEEAFERGIFDNLSSTGSTSVTIGKNAFLSSKITDLTMTSTGALSIGESAFSSATLGTLSSTGSTSVTIGKNAFLSSKTTNLTMASTGALSIGESAFSSATLGTLSSTGSTSVTIGKNAFNSADMTSSTGTYQIITQNNITVGEQSFCATKFGTFLLKSTSGSMSTAKKSFNQANVLSGGTITLFAPAGFSTSDEADNNGSFYDFRLYGNLVIEVQNGDVNIGKYGMDAVSGSGNLTIKASGLFSCGQYAIVDSTFNKVTRYGTYTGGAWETTPCNFIDNTDIYSFSSCKCTGGGELKLDRIQTVGTRCFQYSTVLNPHVQILTPELKTLAPYMFLYADVRYLYIPYVESIYSPDSLDGGSSALNGATYLAELNAPLLTDWNGAHYEMWTLQKVTLGNALYADYATTSIWPGHNDSVNYSYFFPIESTRWEFTTKNSAYYLNLTTDIIAVDKTFAANNDEDGLFRINDCFIGQYILRANGDGTYRIVRLHSPYESANMITNTNPSYKTYNNFTIADKLYGYKLVNGKYEIDLDTEYTITGIDYGSMYRVRFSGSLTFADGILQYGYPDLYAKTVPTDHQIVREYTKTLTSLVFPANATLAYFSFTYCDFSNVTTLTFGNNTNFGQSAFGACKFPSLTTLTIPEGSVFSAANAFDTQEFTNLETLTFGKNVNFYGGQTFRVTHFPKLKKISLTADEVGMKTGGSFLTSSAITNVYALEEIEVEGYIIGDTFFHNVNAPNLTKITFKNCTISNSPFGTSTVGINRDGITLVVTGCTVSASLNYDQEFTNCKATIKDSTLSGGITNFGAGGTIKFENCDFTGACFRINANTSVVVDNCRHTTTDSDIFNSNSAVNTEIDISTCTKLGRRFVKGYWNKVTILNGQTSANYNYTNDNDTYGIIVATSLNKLVINGTFPEVRGTENASTHILSGTVKSIELGSFFQGKTNLTMSARSFMKTDFTSVSVAEFTGLINCFKYFGDYSFYGCKIPSMTTFTLNDKVFGYGTFNYSEFVGITTLTVSNSTISAAFQNCYFNNIETLTFKNNTVGTEAYWYLSSKFKDIGTFLIDTITIGSGAQHTNGMFRSAQFYDVDYFTVKNVPFHSWFFHLSCILSNIEKITIDNCTNVSTDTSTKFLDVKEIEIKNSAVGMFYDTTFDVDEIKITNCSGTRGFENSIVNANITTKGGTYNRYFNNVTVNSNVSWKLNSYTSVGNSWFYNITGAGSVSIELPSVTTATGNNAFNKCPIINEVIFGTALTSFGNATKFLCEDADSIDKVKGTFILNSTTMVTATANTFCYADSAYPSEFKIYVPANLVATYKANAEWSKVQSHIFAIPTGNIDDSSFWKYIFTDDTKTKVAIDGVNGSLPSTGILDIPATLTISGIANPVTVVEIGKNICFGISPVQVNIPATVSYIQLHAFANQTALTTFVVNSASPYFDTELSGSALVSKDKKTLYIVLPTLTQTSLTLSNVEFVYSYAFEKVTLTSLSLPSVKVISSYAFVDLTNPSYTFGPDLYVIGDEIFGGSVKALTDVYFSSTTPPMLLGTNVFETRSTSIDNVGNTYYYSLDEKLTLHVPSIATYAANFSWQQYESILVEPPLVLVDNTNTWEYEFVGNSLNTVTLKKYVSTQELADDNLSFPSQIEVTNNEGNTESLTVVRIGDQADMHNNPTKIVIPATVTELDENALTGIRSVAEFEVDENNPAFKTLMDGKALVSKDGKILYALSLTVSGKVKLPDSIEVIKPYACESINITSLALPSVTQIDDYAFAGATIHTLSVPNADLTKIGENAFFASTITNKILSPYVEIPSTQTRFTVDDFSGIDTIQGFIVDPANTTFKTELGGKALVSYDGTWLYVIVKSIANGDYTLDDVVHVTNYACDGININSLTAPKLSDIYTYSFENAHIGKLVITSADISRSHAAFYNAQIDLLVTKKNIHISSSITSIDEIPVYTTTGITKFIVDSNNQYFSTNDTGTALMSKDGTILYSLTTNVTGNMSLPSVTTVKANACQNIANLGSLTLESVTTIEDNAFLNAKIGTLSILEGATVGANAYQDANIKKIVTIEAPSGE